jgi:hypothetical protein
MITDLDDFEPERPVYGSLSIAAPVVGFALVIAMLYYEQHWGHDSEGWSVLVYGIIIMPLALLAGTVLAIVALRRRERCRGLPLLGLVFNLGPLLLGLIAFVIGK